VRREGKGGGGVKLRRFFHKFSLKGRRRKKIKREGGGGGGERGNAVLLF